MSNSHQYNVSYYATQRGIAESTGIPLTNIPRTLKMLIKKGFVEQSMGYTKDAIRRRKVYFLTEIGKKMAQNLYHELLEQEITIINKHGKSELHPFNEVAKLYNVDVIKILRNLDLQGNIMLEELVQNNNEANKVYFLNYTPEENFFFGRKEELEKIRRFIEHEHKKVIAVYGIAGIGKTSLILKIMQNYRKNYNIFYYRLHEWDSLRSVLTSLSDFLSRLGKKSLRKYLNNNRPCLDEVQAILRKELMNVNSLLVIDEVQNIASDEIVDLLKYLIIIFCAEIENSILIFASRKRVNFYSMKHTLKRSIGEIVLNGLDRESSNKIIEKNINIRNFEEIYNITQGHPLALRFISNCNTLKKGEKNILNYAFNEIYDNLSPKEKELLFFLYTCRYPVTTQMLLDNNFSYETFQRLYNKSFCFKTVLGNVQLHYILRSFLHKLFSHSISENTQIVTNIKIAEYYRKNKTPLNIIAAIYHYFHAKEHEQAIKLAIQYEDLIIENGYSQELIDILETFEKDIILKEDWKSILQLKGNAYNAIGKINYALNLYLQVLELCKNTEKPEIELLLEIGKLYLKKNAFDIALDKYIECLRNAKESDNKENIAYSYYYIGKTYWKKGNLKKSIRCLKKALRFSNQTNNLHLKGKIYMDFAMVYSLRAMWQQAINSSLLSLELLERTGNYYEISKAYNNIGVIYSSRGDYEKAIYYYEKQLRCAEKYDFIRTKVYAFCNIAWAIANKNNVSKQELEKAIGLCSQAFDISRHLKDDRITAGLYTAYGCLFAKMQKWAKAIHYFNHAINYLEKEKDILLLPRIFFWFGKIYKEKGDIANAKKYFNRAYKYYKRRKNRIRIKEIEVELETCV
ncbi:MAG: tetratricopeptide repeat protein [Candidatus Heimdallarchaeum aukensis]|uniref:Tetratricopeptide repeat protein n=1 Tax=Candidatus Heimdallarchaeum aukensis TaxID=2876573 RepID=A0A9Y1BLU6_9ARCH|nr:MAG: tetratricopeptide repeat protein [Candidatus Heimdallarchaeum aukensis]